MKRNPLKYRKEIEIKNIASIRVGVTISKISKSFSLGR